MLASVAFSSLVLAAYAPSSNRVPARLLEHLKTGVNVTRWFCYTQEGEKHYADYLNDADFQAFRRLRVNFVRLCISPDVIDRNGVPDPAVLPYVDRALDRFVGAGIDVIWDLHDNGQLKLDSQPANAEPFISFWQAVTRHYKGRHETAVVFELLNEPQFGNNPEDWYRLQERTVAAIREVDPARTIMVSPTSWSGIDALLKMKPLADSNLIYTFHCYDPFFFTHQGAEWVGEWPGHMKSVPFPSSPEAVSAILDQNPERLRPSLVQYGADRYDATYLAHRIQQAVDWGRENHVPTLFGEFGAYPKVSPPESRARWFEAMRSAIDKAHVPAAIWGYDDALGLGRRVQQDGSLWLDPLTLKNFYGLDR